MFEEGASPGAHLELGARLTMVEEWAQPLVPAYNPALSSLLKARTVWLREDGSRKGWTSSSGSKLQWPYC